MTDENKALVVPPQPGELMATKANEMAKAMIEFLPGGNTLPEATRRAMAMLAVNNGLDPFLGEVYAVPQKRKNERTGTWEIVGYALGIGRGGWLRNAERSGLYQGNEFRFCTPEEEAAMGVQKGDVAMCCNVFKAVSSVRHSGNYRVSGFGIVGVDEKSKMNHFQLSRKRAFVDALRNAFPMAVPKMNGEQMQVRVVDDETGEILGNGHDLARECEPTAPLQIAQAEETQAGEFTEAAPDSTPYQPEGMPVVEATPQAPPPQSPMAKAMNRGELLNQLNLLHREWYPSAPGIALANHLKAKYGAMCSAMSDLNDTQLREQIAVFTDRIAERKAAVDAQPQLAGVTQ
jgi:hypothetical protein